MKKILLFFTIFLLCSKQVLAEEIKQPRLVIKTADGKNFDLKNKRGKVVIVNFWVSWCLNCRAEMEILKEIYSEYKRTEVEIIGISVDRKREYKAFEKIAQKLPYQNFLISHTTENDFGEPDLLPSTYIVDKKGDAILLETPDNRASTKEDFERILLSLNNGR